MRTSRTAHGRAMRPARAARDRPLARLGRRLAAAAGLVMLMGSLPAAALDATARTPVPGGSYRNAREALRTGVRDRGCAIWRDGSCICSAPGETTAGACPRPPRARTQPRH